MRNPGTAAAQATAVERPRIKRLRRDLIKAIPRVPNNKASLQHMEAKHLTDLLIAYINWRSRYVGERPRTISIEPAAQADPRWSDHAAAIKAFLDKVERGDDLTPHLSIEPHTRGYSPAARARGATPDDRWSDKDFLLNVMGFHHFHLGTATQKRGHVDRTDDLIFAEVRRDTFKVIAIFDHDVFDKGSAERMRLWALHESIISRGIAPGTVVVPAMIATSGHTVHVVRYAQDCARIIREFEPKLDDSEYVKSLYSPPEDAPATSKLSWGFRHLDLAIYDAAKPVFMILKKGWS
ncbi:hypothetical protein ACQR1W_30965 [Bradyrhizobium sp. HKCCYLS1011]|uniref:hypothetical protein n=1 Tax=Bradyrhizobium sp. HKCCYLS1011 TaxID=3420733 RepID=UPI003EB9C6CA